MKALSPKHRQFVDELLRSGMNASKAYMATGYSRRGADANAARLMARPDVRAEIRRLQDSFRADTAIQYEEAIEILSCHARDRKNYKRSIKAIEVLAKLLRWEDHEPVPEDPLPSVEMLRGLSFEAKVQLVNKYGPNVHDHPKEIERLHRLEVQGNGR